MVFSRYAGWLMSTGPVQKFLQGRIPPGGPADGECTRGKSFSWGEVSEASNNRKAARLGGPEGYTFNALTVLKICEKVLAGDFKAGFQTPAKAYGPDLVLQIEEVTREDT